MSALALELSSPVDSPKSHSIMFLDDHRPEDQLPDAVANAFPSLSDNSLIANLHTSLLVSTASCTSYSTSSVPYPTACSSSSSSSSRSSYASTIDSSFLSTSSAYYSLPLNSLLLLDDYFSSPSSRFTSSSSSSSAGTSAKAQVERAQGEEDLVPRRSRRTGLKFVDEKLNDEERSGLADLDLPSLTLNSRKRQRPVLEESEAHTIDDDSDYNPRKPHRSNPLKKQQKAKKMEVETKTLSEKSKTGKAQKEKHTKFNRRVVCNHGDCRTSFSRSADWSRHCESVHGIFTNRDREDRGCRKCGKVLSRVDAKQRHELTCVLAGQRPNRSKED